MHDWRSELRSRLGPLNLSPARVSSIVDELAQHLEDRRAELIAAGVEPDRAAQMAQQELERADLLGARLSTLRQARWSAPPVPGSESGGWLTGAWQDVRYAWRALRRDPVLSVVAVLTLAFGIGLNTAMFGFTNALLFRPLPFPDADRLVRVFRTTAQNQSGGFAAADYLALRRSQEGIGRFGAYQPSTLMATQAGWSAEWVRVSADMFDVLGVPSLLGRSFRADDELPGNGRVVLISHALWRAQFAGADDVVGRTVQTTDGAYEVIGVLPPAASDHRLFGRAGLFSPLSFSKSSRTDRTAYTLTILGRWADGVTDARGAAFLAATASRVVADAGAGRGEVGWRSEGLPHSNTGPTGRAILAMLLGLSAFVLLIACSNLANLLLARAIDRVREFAVRVALGASRARLMRAVVLESVLLSVAGAAGALLVATWTSAWLQSVIEDGGAPAIPVDWRVMGFAAVVALATVVACSLAPALFAGRVNTNDALKVGGRGATGARGHARLRNAFVAGQFALATILLAGAAFFLSGTLHMISQQYGWNADRVVQAEITVPEDRYPEDRHVSEWQQAAIERLKRLPGVQSASISYGLPFMGLRGQAHYVGDGDAGARPVLAKINGISPEYFDVTGTRLVAGRPFVDADTAASPKVAIVSESMARRLVPEGSALGRRVAAPGPESQDWMEIVGVVADVRPIDVATPPVPYQLYQPVSQDPRRQNVLALRLSDHAGPSILPAVSAAIAEIDPALSVRRLMTARDRMREVTSSVSLVLRLLGGFAVLGVLLAALGIYGAMTRMVAQRTSEIGLRIALGAQIRSVLGLVLRSGARLTAIGLGIGLAGAVGLSRLLASVFPSMEIDDGLAAGMALAVLMLVALASCYLPARRAARVDPVVALHTD
jgi:predicted permease